MKMRRVLTGLLLATVCAGTMAGCGRKTEYNPSDDIVLHEPVNASANTEKAACRDLSQYVTYVGTVYPEVEEYSFTKNVTISQIHYYPGQEVHKGDVLVTADNTQVVKQIEAIEDQIKQLDKNYEEQMQDYDLSIADQQKNLQPKKDWAQYSINDKWLKYQIQTMELSLANTERQKQNTIELYEYDRAYLVKKLNALKQEAKVLRLVSDRDGVVVKLAEHYAGDSILADEGMIGIATLGEKYFKCEYISEKKINKAARYYLMINGERYDVTYIPYATGEYDTLVAKGETAWATFRINDPEGKVEYGDMAMLCVIEAEEKGCISVPSSALHKDEAGTYVFVVNGNENDKVYVEKGFSDGAYTQLLSGVREGDYVLLSEYTTYGTNTVTLSRNDFINSYSGAGEMAFPEYSLVSNDIEYGDVKFVSYEVQMYQQVKKGEVVANVQVVGDQVLLTQKNRELTRMRERRQDLVDSLNDPEANRSAAQIQQINRRIANYDTSIAELEEEIGKITASYQTTKIRATSDGIVMWMAFLKDGEALRKDDFFMFIAKNDPCYIATKNTNQQLNYGDEIALKYKDEEGQEYQMTGTVVSTAAATVSSSMSSEYAYIAFSKEDFMKLTPTQDARNGGYFQMAQYDLEGTQRSMNNVVTVPKSAVTTVGGQTYVRVMEKNGEIVNRSFIAGGFNTDCYWVLEGLEEGTTICLE